MASVRLVRLEDLRQFRYKMTVLYIQGTQVLETTLANELTLNQDQGEQK